jgi:hypothetical protein
LLKWEMDGGNCGKYIQGDSLVRSLNSVDKLRNNLSIKAKHCQIVTLVGGNGFGLQRSLKSISFCLDTQAQINFLLSEDAGSNSSFLHVFLPKQSALTRSTSLSCVLYLQYPS